MSSSSSIFFGYIPVCDCCCNCYDFSGGKDQGEAADGNVRAVNGSTMLSNNGVGGSGYNVPIHTELNYSNLGSGSYNGPAFGSSWQSHGLAGLTFPSGTTEIDYQEGPNQNEVYTQTATDLWEGVYFNRSRIERDSGTGVYTMTLKDGSQRIFDNTGTLTGLRNAGGQEFSVATTGTTITIQHPPTGTAAVSYLYEISGGHVTGVTQSINGQAVKFTGYTYYPAVGSIPGQLKQVTNREFDGSGWLDTESTFYSYHGADNEGLLKYVFKDGTLRRMASVGLNPETTPEPALWADLAFSYDSLARVIALSTHGGNYTWGFDYVPSGFSGGANDWTDKTVITRPDTSIETVYFNQAGSVMLRKVTAGADTWYPTCQRFDDKLRVVQVIAASAITDVNESWPELFTFDPDAGMVREFTYHATASQALKEDGIRTGTGFTKLRSFEYSETSTGSGVWVPSSTTVFANEAGTVSYETVYEYTFHSGTFQMQTRTTKQPDVAASQNGTGAHLQTVETFDINGFRVQFEDQSGTITKYTVDSATGGITEKIVDFGSGKLNLTTNYVLDDEGRVLIEKGPEHEIDLNGVITKIRSAVWNYYRDPRQERISFPGYIVMSDTHTELTSHCVGPVSIQRDFVLPELPDGTSFSDRIAAAWTLVRLPLPDEIYEQSTWTRWQRQQTSPKSEHIADLVYHVIPSANSGTVDVNYALTTFLRDSAGRVSVIITPGGTRQQSRFNAMGWAESQLVGTAEGNMFTTVNDVFNIDGLRTKTTVHVDNDTGNDRVTDFVYDLRQRQWKASTIVRVGSSDVTLITENTYDNRNLVTEVREYQAAVDIPANLLSQTRILHDSLARPYRREVYRVVPGTSTSPTDFLYDDTWYDAVGRVLAQQPSGSQAFQFTDYDAAGRATAVYTAYAASSSSSSGSNPPPAISASIVMEQRNRAYDDAGNVTLTTLRQRYDNATGSGVLNNSTTQPKARVSYVGTWPDALGRTIATANAGTNGNATWSRPPLIPACSGTLLVTLTGFNPAGEAWLTTDPMGAQTTRTWDAAGRLIDEVQGRVPGRTMPAINRRTGYRYNPAGNLTHLIAFNNTASGLIEQVTEWVYGVNTSTDTGVPGHGSALCSNLLVAKKIYPGSTGGSDEVAYTYNGVGQVRTLTDQAGLVHAYTYDQLGRQTADTVTDWGASAADRTVEALKTVFDVRGLVASAGSYGSGSSPVNEVSFTHNGWRQVTAETQTEGAVSRTIQYGYDSGAANTIRRNNLTYPSGEVMHYLYGGTHGNQLSRVSTLQDGSTGIVSYTWLGLSNPVDVSYDAISYHQTLGTSADNYAGFDQFGRPVDIQWKSGSAVRVRAQYGYDRSSNRQWRYDAAAHADGATNQDQWYEYDGLYQVQGYQRGALNGTWPNFSGITPVAENQNWNYDAMGNWLAFTSDALSQTRQFNAVNEITTLTGPAGAVTPLYDPAGNMVTMPGIGWTAAHTLTWDAWNRLVKVSMAGVPSAEYAYDALFRRIWKQAIWEGATRKRRFYYNDQWQILEEYVGAESTPEKRYWYGIRDLNDIARGQYYSDSESLQHDYYALRETMNVVALVDAIEAGQPVIARFRYDAFGNAIQMSRTWSIPGTLVFWPILFHAHYRDYETGLYQMRFRYYHPKLGVWLSRDPIGELGGSNLTAFNTNNSANTWDLLALVNWVPDGKPERKVFIRIPLYRFLAKIESFPYLDNECCWVDDYEQIQLKTLQLIANLIKEIDRDSELARNSALAQIARLNAAAESFNESADLFVAAGAAGGLISQFIPSIPPWGTLARGFLQGGSGVAFGAAAGLKAAARHAKEQASKVKVPDIDKRERFENVHFEIINEPSGPLNYKGRHQVPMFRCVLPL